MVVEIFELCRRTSGGNSVLSKQSVSRSILGFCHSLSFATIFFVCRSDLASSFCGTKYWSLLVTYLFLHLPWCYGWTSPTVFVEGLSCLYLKTCLRTISSGIIPQHANVKLHISDTPMRLVLLLLLSLCSPLICSNLYFQFETRELHCPDFLCNDQNINIESRTNEPIFIRLDQTTFLCLAYEPFSSYSY